VLHCNLIVCSKLLQNFVCYRVSFECGSSWTICSTLKSYHCISERTRNSFYQWYLAHSTEYWFEYVPRNNFYY